ncbi:hypothetical protein [Parvibacter caecicola]|uniref:Uncharacterized protein n=1 Tax=Parvibacter caecicola TaxID=747645 RepID=A0A4T9T8X9_9ACTN|nr:hypothetical protein [Parvibacter caecicola]TJW11510.1 hypothetical protein E5982_04750 [Parvibacter caecicola]
MTLDIYAGVDPEAKRQAVKYIEGAFDDTMSVFQRETERRRAEKEGMAAEPKPSKIAKISPNPSPSLLTSLEPCLS